MLSRCMWYDDDGNKLPDNRGCTNSSCLFIHPDDSRWARAERRKTAKPPRAWTKRRRPSPSSDTWLPRSKPEKSSASGGSHQQKMRQWGSSSASTPWEPTAKAASPFSVDWPLPQTVPEKDSGWASPREFSWSGSGGSIKPLTSASSAWPTDDTIKDTPAENAPTIPTQPAPLPFLPSRKSSSSSLGSTTTRAADRLHSTASLSAPAKDVNPPLPLVGRPRPSISIPTSHKSSMAFLASTPVEKGSMGPPPLPISAKGKEVDRSHYRHPSTLSVTVSAHNSDATRSRESSVQVSESDRRASGPRPGKIDLSQSLVRAKPPATPEERQALHRNVIKHIQILVSLTFQMKAADIRFTRFKRTQKHPLYFRCGPRAREIMSERTASMHATCEELKKRRDRSLTSLAALPDFPTRPKVYDIEGDRKKIIDYTTQLKAWLQNIDLPARLRALQPPPIPEEPSPPTVEQNATATESSSQTQQSGQPKRTWASVNQHLDEMYRKLRDIESNLGTDLALDMSAYDPVFDSFRHEVEKSREKQELRAIQTSIEMQNYDLRVFDQRLRMSVDDSSVTHHRAQALDDRLRVLEEETEELNKINDEDEKRLDAMEETQRKKQEQIEKVADLLRQMALARKSPPTHRQVRQVTIDGIGPEIKQHLVDRIIDEVRPIFQAILDSAKQRAELVKVELDEMVDPIVKQTDRIVTHARSQPQPLPAS